ncbi:FeoB-associated Cys-rich membrane protein [Clostridiisalibacter paucivorans]|uniref:FeoB-associated Cys-rich membrane protein n=1 Tax=Clostridiisalibacter paucivorans TaxID=408753 RepID=UPI0009FBB4C2|nr:FeoB-associated Cys-rich membrane protein [Clostridiisalibacter paucivorans]
MGTFVTVLLTLLIAGYSIYVINKHIRNRTKGQCSGCSSCPSSNMCSSKKE